MPAASCISAEAPRSQLGQFLLFQIKNLNFLKTEAAGLWLQTPELEFGNVFSTLPPLYPCINAIGALLLSLDTLTVTVDNTAGEFVQLESCISAPEASSSTPTSDCSSPAKVTALLPNS